MRALLGLTPDSPDAQSGLRHVLTNVAKGNGLNRRLVYEKRNLQLRTCDEPNITYKNRIRSTYFRITVLVKLWVVLVGSYALKLGASSSINLVGLRSILLRCLFLTKLSSS